MSVDLLSEEMGGERPAAGKPAVASVERVFERGAAPTWDGKLVKPFSGKRLIAADSCGMRCFKVLATGGSIEGMYDGIFWDAVITVYLCTAPDSTVLLAVRRPEKVCEAAMAWAEEQDLSPVSPKFLEMATLFGEIMEDILVSGAMEPGDRADGEKVVAQKKIPTDGSTGSSSSECKSAVSPEETSRTS